MNTTQENNRLIAEFMGLKVLSKEEYLKHPKHGTLNVTEYSISEYQRFHSSWDWLMPVGAKCLEKSLSLRQYPFIDIKIKEAVQSFKIEATYQAVVEFIEWYNSHLIS